MEQACCAERLRDRTVTKELAAAVVAHVTDLLKVMKVDMKHPLPKMIESICPQQSLEECIMLRQLLLLKLNMLPSLEEKKCSSCR